MSLTRQQVLQMIRELTSYGDQLVMASRRGPAHVTVTSEVAEELGNSLCKWADMLTVLIGDGPVSITETIDDLGEG